MRPARAGSRRPADRHGLAGQNGDPAGRNAHRGPDVDRHGAARRLGCGGADAGHERGQRRRSTCRGHARRPSARAARSGESARRCRPSSSSASLQALAPRAANCSATVCPASAGDSVPLSTSLGRRRCAVNVGSMCDAAPRRVQQSPGRHSARPRTREFRSSAHVRPGGRGAVVACLDSGLNSRTSCCLRPGAYGVSCRAREPPAARSRGPSRALRLRPAWRRASRFAPARRFRTAGLPPQAPGNGSPVHPRTGRG